MNTQSRPGFTAIHALFRPPSADSGALRPASLQRGWQGAMAASLVGAVAALGFGDAHAANTENYLGWGAPGDPGWAEENYLQYASSGDHNTIRNAAYFYYFTKTGFTDTTRDRLEYWIGGAFGYQNANHQPTSAGGWGGAAPDVGFEYYYNVIPLSGKKGDNETWWTAQLFDVNFPNGDNKSAGYGAGANQFSIDFTSQNYYQNGRFAMSFEPAWVTYAFRNEHKTTIVTSAGSVFTRRLRGGWSMSFGIANLAYEVKPDLYVGIYHGFNVYALADSDAHRSAEGTIGPSIAYSGLSKYGIDLQATVQTDYYHSASLNQSVYLAFYVNKHF
jgi:hypothetical protein